MHIKACGLAGRAECSAALRSCLKLGWGWETPTEDFSPLKICQTWGMYCRELRRDADRAWRQHGAPGPWRTMSTAPAAATHKCAQLTLTAATRMRARCAPHGSSCGLEGLSAREGCLYTANPPRCLWRRGHLSSSKRITIVVHAFYSLPPVKETS